MTVNGVDPFIFQSTPPARGATDFHAGAMAAMLNFNPRPPHGERPIKSDTGLTAKTISIHAPRTGSDFTPIRILTKSKRFQSTPPARGATIRPTGREGCNPIFQSTPPARGATIHGVDRNFRRRFQSTPPARGATQNGITCKHSNDYFNPRPPHGERHAIKTYNKKK